MMVAFFAVNLYLGNWLKNLFALARPPTARGPASFDFSWPSLYAVNSVGLPFFALRYWFGAFGTGTAFSAEYQITTGVLYATAIVWVLLTCGARLYSGASSPADVQGGMLMGGIFVRIWLPLSDVASAWIVAPDAQLLGVPQWAVLIAIGILALLLHPFTPGEPRSWIAFAFSVKAVAFGYAFIVGSNLCARLQCAADVLGPAGTDLWVPLTDVRVLARCAAARPPRTPPPRPALSHGLTAPPPPPPPQAARAQRARLRRARRLVPAREGCVRRHRGARAEGGGARAVRRDVCAQLRHLLHDGRDDLARRPPSLPEGRPVEAIRRPYPRTPHTESSCTFLLGE